MSTPVQHAANLTSSGKPKIRRRRLTLFVILLVGILLFLFPPWDMPRISRSSMGQIMRTKKAPVEEIYGLLRLVTGDRETEHVLSKLDMDPTSPIALSVYAAGESDVNWHREKDLIDEEYPIVVFSKTYCPYSRRAKQLLESYDLQPPPKVIEVDLRDDGIIIKHLLTRLTQHSTFPNILLRGKSIGGSDSLQSLHANGLLKRILEGTGASARSTGATQ